MPIIVVLLGGHLGGIAERVGGPLQNAPGSSSAPRLHRRARSGEKRDTRVVPSGGQLESAHPV